LVGGEFSLRGTAPLAEPPQDDDAITKKEDIGFWTIFLAFFETLGAILLKAGL